VSSAPATSAEYKTTLAAWARRHARHGIASAVLDGPETGHDPDLAPSATVYVVERPGEPAYLLQLGGPMPGWSVWCCGRERTIGAAPDLLGALCLIRTDHQDTRAAA
jgi:hypothetical protein